jgi:hypothetical protein
LVMLMTLLLMLSSSIGRFATAITTVAATSTVTLRVRRFTPILLRGFPSLWLAHSFRYMCTMRGGGVLQGNGIENQRRLNLYALIL